MFSALGKSESSKRSMGTAPHIKGRFSSQLNRFSCEHALAAGKTPVWLNIAQPAPIHNQSTCDRAFMISAFLDQDPLVPAANPVRRGINRLLPVGFALIGIGLSVLLGRIDMQRQQLEQPPGGAARRRHACRPARRRWPA